MKPFTYERADDARPRPPRPSARTPGAKFIAGGTNLLDLMKLRDRDADASDRRQRSGARHDRGDRRGRAAHRRAGAQHRSCGRRARAARLRRAVARACVAGASGQLRNKATTGGQSAAAHALPVFLRHQPGPATSASPGRGCAAIGGFSRQPGASSASATPASPPIPATWRWRCARSTRWSRRSKPDGAARAIPIAEFHRLPGDDAADRDRRWQPGELITAVTLPKPVGGTHIYHKVRDRASYAFALVSVAAVIQKRRHRPRRRSAASRPSRGASRRPKRRCRRARRP